MKKKVKQQKDRINYVALQRQKDKNDKIDNTIK